MIYLRISEKFRTGTRELLNLFFPNNDFTFIDDTKEVSRDDVLVAFDIASQNNGFNLRSRTKKR